MNGTQNLVARDSKINRGSIIERVCPHTKIITIVEYFDNVGEAQKVLDSWRYCTTTAL